MTLIKPLNLTYSLVKELFRFTPQPTRLCRVDHFISTKLPPNAGEAVFFFFVEGGKLIRIRPMLLPRQIYLLLSEEMSPLRAVT
jgi:hypothetical protein